MPIIAQVPLKQKMCPTGRCGHRGKVDNCQVGVFMGYVSDQDHALLDFRLSLPEEWARDEQRRQECHVPSAVRSQTRHEQC
jgi:SRSO17 transposase